MINNNVWFPFSKQGKGAEPESAKLYFMFQINWHHGISMGTSYSQAIYRCIKDPSKSGNYNVFVMEVRMPNELEHFLSCSAAVITRSRVTQRVCLFSFLEKSWTSGSQTLLTEQPITRNLLESWSWVAWEEMVRTNRGTVSCLTKLEWKRWSHVRSNRSVHFKEECRAIWITAITSVVKASCYTESHTRESITFTCITITINE